jgi:hypothetical protein
MWRQASLPAVEGGILPPGKKLRRAKRFGFTEVSSVATPIRRAGSHGSTSAKMADATFFRQALSPDSEIEQPQKNAKDTKRIGLENFPSRRFCDLRFHHSRPLQKAALVVAAVCDRRRFPIISRPLGAHRAPLQGFCRGSHSSVLLCVLCVLSRQLRFSG